MRRLTPKPRGRRPSIARMLDTYGSVIGPLVLFVLLYLLKDVEAKYRIILIATALPLLATLAIVVVKVKETQSDKKPDKKLAVSLTSGSVRAWG
jgi:hypothetical protein